MPDSRLGRCDDPQHENEEWGTLAKAAAWTLLATFNIGLEVMLIQADSPSVGLAIVMFAGIWVAEYLLAAFVVVCGAAGM